MQPKTKAIAIGGILAVITAALFLGLTYRPLSQPAGPNTPPNNPQNQPPQNQPQNPPNNPGQSGSDNEDENSPEEQSNGKWNGWKGYCHGQGKHLGIIRKAQALAIRLAAC